MIPVEVNGKNYEVEVTSDTPLLWVIRENLGLTGTKYGCGKSLCGACTVHIDGKPARSCQTPVKNVQGKKITTIEGIPEDHPVKLAWNAEDVPQCGYCQPGQIMDAVALLEKNPHQRMAISPALWPAISADVALTSVFDGPFTLPQRSWPKGKGQIGVEYRNQRMPIRHLLLR